MEFRRVLIRSSGTKKMARKPISLLSEIGFLAIFFAPLQLKPDLERERQPSPVVLWLLRLLLFRLMFSSGLSKLLSGDPTWRHFTALNYHYERPEENIRDRKSTRLNSSHANISYAVFCLKKKKK